MVLVGTRRSCRAVGPAACSRRSSTATARSSSAATTANTTPSNSAPSTLLREGRTVDYLTHARRGRRLDVADTATEAKARLVADWWNAAGDDPAGSVMVAYRRADVAELNTVARTILDEQRQARPATAPPREWARGRGGRPRRPHPQRPVPRRRQRQPRQVVDINPPRGRSLSTSRRRRLALPARYLEPATSATAYALTGHKMQGLTVERAFVLADDDGALREWGYVALAAPARRPASTRSMTSSSRTRRPTARSRQPG